MRCVILAAGMATRLGELTKGLPKCLLPIGGKPILQRIIENVAASGIEQIGVVIGYNAEAIRAFVKRHFPYLRIRFIVNPRYESTNNAFSLLMAREFFMHDARQGNPVYGLLLLDADIVFPQSLLPEFLAHKATDKIAVRVAGVHDEEEVRVKLDSDGFIRQIGKTIPLAETYGESIGVEAFSPETARRLFDEIGKRVLSGEGRNEFYEAAFQLLLDQGVAMKPVDTSAFPSREIDTPEDLLVAKEMVAGYAARGTA